MLSGGKRAREEDEPTEANDVKRQRSVWIPPRFIDAKGQIAVLQIHFDVNIWYIVPLRVFFDTLQPLAKAAGFQGASLLTYLQSAPEVKDYTPELIAVGATEDADEATRSFESAVTRRWRESTALDKLLRYTWKQYRVMPKKETGVFNPAYVVTLLGGSIYKDDA